MIRARTDLTPRVAIVLGSGLGGFVNAIEDATAIPYRELDGFPLPSVSGHAGSLVVGRVGGQAVAVMAGRGHFYEHGRADIMRPALETLKALSVGDLILTNSAGGLRQEIPPGSVMLIADHINLNTGNPLIGEPSDARFVGLTQAYNANLRQAALAAAKEEGIELREGVYMWFSGPSFETPAEIRAARILGADAVGMSTVPEAILARFLGLRVLAFSVVTNYAAGMTGQELSHQETKDVAPRGGEKLQRILIRMLADWPERD
ncbi:MAG: purine-nucleoside phosphorylase [Propylenella sp.]